MRLDDLIRETHKTALLQQKESGAALLLLQASIRKRNPDTSASASAAIVPGLLLALLVLASSKVGKSLDAHHQILLSHLLAHISFLDQAIFHLFFQIHSYLKPYDEAVELLVSIPGIAQETAACILAEIGVDMSCFPTAAHLASWAGVCPGNRESGGKRLSGKINKGNARLKAALAEVVWVLSHMKDNYLSAQYHRLARRLGKQKAVMAVAHSLLVIIYHMLRDKQPYRDLGATFFETRDKERAVKGARRRLESLGYTVTLQPQEEVSA